MPASRPAPNSARCVRVTRVPRFALTCIVVAAAVAWYQLRTPDDAGNVANTAAQPDSHRLPAAEASREMTREESDRPFLQATAGVAEMPVEGMRSNVVGPVSQVSDLSTGAATGWPAPENRPTGSGAAGILSANDEIESATGIVVSRESADSTTAVAPARAPSAGIEIDPATGAAIAR